MNGNGNVTSQQLALDQLAKLHEELGSVSESDKNGNGKLEFSVLDQSTSTASAAGALDRDSAQEKVERICTQPLFNATEPLVVLKGEKYNHRLMAIMKSSGMTNVQIANELGCSVATVNYAVKQPIAQEVIMARMFGVGDKAMAKLQAEAEAAVDRLIAISKDDKANSETRRKANNDILDRKYGKPNQPYSTSTKSAEEMPDDELLSVVKGN